MAKYPNQRTVKICKVNSTEYFAMYGNPEIGEACKVLNGSGFKVWAYIFSNSNGFILDISPADGFKYWGISPSTFEDGINELITKGFIVDGVAYQHSTKDESEIQKKKRNSDGRENDTILVSEYTENGESNNKYITNSKEEVLDTSVSNFTEFIETINSSWLDKNLVQENGYCWRNCIDENNIWTAKSGKRFKINFDN